MVISWGLQFSFLISLAVVYWTPSGKTREEVILAQASGKSKLFILCRKKLRKQKLRWKNLRVS